MKADFEVGGLCRIPGALRPVEIVQRALSAAVQAAADQPTGRPDQRRQYVRRQWMAPGGRAGAPLRVDAGIVNDRMADRVDLTRVPRARGSTPLTGEGGHPYTIP